MPKPTLFCQTCQIRFSKRGFTRHAGSIAHKRAKLIRAMLDRHCITHAEIAKRIGLTRERVRQIALTMGFADGRSRHAICRMERRRKEMAEFFVAAEQHGFAVEPLGKRRGYINGKICVQRQACWHLLGKGKYRYRYIKVRRPSGQFDICAWKLPDGRFLILPKNLVRFTQTLFNPDEPALPGTNITCHFYRDYLDRWNLLGQPRQM